MQALQLARSKSDILASTHEKSQSSGSIYLQLHMREEMRIFAIISAIISVICYYWIHSGKKQNVPPKSELFRHLYGLRQEYDLIIVGAGLSGTVLAEQASRRSNLKSLVLDKRDHIGGNCYDFINEHGIRVSKYGAHIFHTKHKQVWEYVQKYSEWIPYHHKVKGQVSDFRGNAKIVPIPPNQDTVNALFGENITNIGQVSGAILFLF